MPTISFAPSFFASATASANDFAGSDGLETTIIGVVATIPMGGEPVLFTYNDATTPGYTH